MEDITIPCSIDKSKSEICCVQLDLAAIERCIQHVVAIKIKLFTLKTKHQLRSKTSLGVSFACFNLSSGICIICFIAFIP